MYPRHRQARTHNFRNYFQKKTNCRYDPALTYGRVKNQSVAPFRPHFVMYDKVVLTFRAFFKQSVPESNKEYYRVRNVNILYFMEDDSVTVIEPPILVNRKLPHIHRIGFKFPQILGAEFRISPGTHSETWKNSKKCPRRFLHLERFQHWN